MIAIDPVCKMEVDTETAEWKTEHMGKMYYFCAPGCLASFEKEPDKYLMGDGGHEGHMHHDHEGHDHHDH